MASLRAALGSGVPFVAGTLTQEPVFAGGVKGHLQPRWGTSPPLAPFLRHAPFLEDYLRLNFGQGLYGDPSGIQQAASPCSPAAASCFTSPLGPGALPRAATGALPRVGLADSAWVVAVPAAPASGDDEGDGGGDGAAQWRGGRRPAASLLLRDAPSDPACPIHFSVAGLLAMGDRYFDAFHRIVMAAEREVEGVGADGEGGAAAAAGAAMREIGGRLVGHAGGGAGGLARALCRLFAPEAKCANVARGDTCVPVCT